MQPVLLDQCNPHRDEKKRLSMGCPFGRYACGEGLYSMGKSYTECAADSALGEMSSICS